MICCLWFRPKLLQNPGQNSLKYGHCSYYDFFPLKEEEQDLEGFRESVMLSSLLLQKSRNLSVNIHMRMCGSKEQGLKVYHFRVCFHAEDPSGISTITNTNFTEGV